MITIRTIEELEAERERQRKKWIKSGKEQDWFYLDLEGADLSKANLMGADLSKANLMGANLTDANLTDANLNWAYLKWADLTGADLRGAIFLRTQIFQSLFRNTIITQSQWANLKVLYRSEFMAGFVVKELEEYDDHHKYN